MGKRTRHPSHLTKMQMSPRNGETASLAAVGSQDYEAHKVLECSGSFLVSPEFPFDMRTEHAPKDFKRHPVWVAYQDALASTTQRYVNRLRCTCAFSVIGFYISISVLPFVVLVQTEFAQEAHLFFCVYVFMSMCMEVYLSYIFTSTDRQVDELETIAHQKLATSYPKLRIQEEEQCTALPWFQTALAMIWGQLSRLDTYLHMCFVAVLSADDKHPVLWGVSLGFILLFLVFYNWTLYVLTVSHVRSTGVYRATRHMAAYTEFYGLYLLSSQYQETQELDLSTHEIIDLPSVSESTQDIEVSPAAFRYLKWIVEDTVQAVLLILYLVSEEVNGLVAYSAAVSLLMLLSGALLLLFRKRLRHLLR